MSTQYQTPQAVEPEKLNEPPLTPGEVAQTLAELIAMGFVKRVKDGFGITRDQLVHRGAKELETNDDFVA
jgi:hypothetical protein